MSTRPQTMRPAPAPARAPAPQGGNILTRKIGPLPGWAWMVIAGVGAYAVFRFVKSKKAKAKTTATGATATTQPAVVYVTTPATKAGGGGAGGGGGTPGGGRATKPPAGAPTPPTAAAAPATQIPTVTIGGKSYKVLGKVGTQAGYTVYGGVPVYFGNANAIAQGPTAQKPGAYEYVPATTTPNLIYKRGTAPPAKAL